MMNAADLHDLELVWPSLDPTNVFVTGTFDQWSSSIRLVKGNTGFSSTVKVPWGQKIWYKFIVDGRWHCRDDQPQEDDGHGNMNNVLRTPEKPLPLVHDPPTRLSIPLEHEGFGDLEAMVTAVEYLTPAEPATIKGSLPLPIPQITVEGLDQAPSAGTPVSESKLNTAAATEGHISPTSEAKLDPLEHAPSSCDISGPVSVQSVNGNGEARDSHDISTHAPIQLAEEELFTSPPASESANGAALDSTAPQHLSQATHDTPASTDHVDALPVPGPVAVLRPPTKETQVDPVETSHPQQAISSASVGLVSASSTPPSSTLTQKKRRSFLARIKHMFNKDNGKQEKKERNMR